MKPKSGPVHGTGAGPSDAWGHGVLGWALGLSGHKTEAETIYRDLERQREKTYIGGVALALVRLGLGDRDHAYLWLEKAADERDGRVSHVNAWFPFIPLRSDPRFQALLKKMNFPSQPQG